jgi:hypothetical protein
MLGNGDGTFQAPVQYTAGNEPISVAIEDFNGDGKPDLAVANSGANQVLNMLGGVSILGCCGSRPRRCVSARWRLSFCRGMRLHRVVVI